MHSGRCNDTFLGCPTNTDYQPYYQTRNEAAYRNHQRSVLPPPEGMHEEDRMGQNLAARHPMDLQTDEEVLHHSEGRAPTVADLGPHSPDLISSSLVPYGMGEDSSPEEDQVQQDQAPEQMEAEEEDPPMEEATSKLRMGLHVGPAKYQPASPKYVRAEEGEEEEDDDLEAPYLAPRDRVRAKDYSEDGPLISSSESIPALIDLDEEIPPCPTLTPPRSRNAVHPATLGIGKGQKDNSSSSGELPPSPLSSDKEKPEKRSTPEATQEGPVAKEQVPEESIIYIDDDLEPSPLAKLEVQVDKLLMPPPAADALVAAGTLLAISQGPLVLTKADQQPHQSLEKRRSGAVGKKLQDRRKARKPLKLDIQAVAKMHTGPRNVHRSQELARLASAVVPLQQLDIVADDTNGKTPRPETPAPQNQ